MNMDSSAALALNLREGLGKAKHICIQELWMQETIKAGRMSLDKVAGEHNPADFFYKRAIRGQDRLSDGDAGIPLSVTSVQHATAGRRGEGHDRHGESGCAACGGVF